MIKTNKPPIFLVRLDETVLWGSLSQELAIKFLRENLLNIFLLLLWSLRGPAYCMYQVSMRVRLDPSLLLYREKLLDYLQEKKKQGVRLILYSDATDSVVQMIARHLNIFHESLGSSPRRTLTPIRRLEWYRSRYGNHDYVLISNGLDDQPLWCNAAMTVLVNCGSKLRNYISEALALPVLKEIVEVTPSNIEVLFRPHLGLWLRNFSVLLFFLLFSSATFGKLVAQPFEAIIALLAFSALGSAGLILDRILNVWEDRETYSASEHTRNRALCHLDLRDNLLWMTLLVIFGGSMAYISIDLVLWSSVVYLVLGVFYAYRLRNEMFINMFVPAFQVAVVGLGLSWAMGLIPQIALLAGIFFFFLSMELLRAFGQIQQGGTYGVYKTNDSGIISTLGLVAGIIAVAMLILHLVLTAPLADNGNMIVWVIIPIALYWIARIWFLAYRQVITGDPASFLMKDEQSYLVLLSLFFVVFLTI